MATTAPGANAAPLDPFWLSLVVGCAALGAWSLAGTEDRAVWAFEVLPMAAVLSAFAYRRRHFRYSRLAYGLLAWFFAIQCVGGRYTFELAPFPTAIRDWLGLERNPVDRIGHFFQGFVPAIVLREFLLRRRGLVRGPTLFLLVAGCCLGFSAAYELLEMAVVLIFYPEAGPEWLGMQGDPFDAQWDMTMALGGAISAQLLLARRHDRSIERAIARAAG